MKRTYDLLDEKIRPEKIILHLAWPTILEQLLLSCVQYADTGMVGALGKNASAAVSLCSSTTWLINGICAALGVGFSVLIGHSMGAKDFDRSKRVMRQAFIAMLLFGLVIGLLFFGVAQVLPDWMGADPAIREDATVYMSILSVMYLFNVANVISGNIIRCMGDTKTPMWCNIFANLLNVALNFLLINKTRVIDIYIKPFFMDAPLIDTEFTMWGAGLGIKGAAIASVISIAIATIIITSRLFTHDYPCKISFKDRFRIDGDVWKDMFKIAYPVALERVALSGGQIFMTRMVTGLGTTMLAAHHLAITAESITYLPAFGFSVAATTLVSQSLGAKKFELAKKHSKYCLFGGMMFMTVMGVVLFLFAEQLVGILTPDPDVIAAGAGVLGIEAFAQTMFGASTVVSGILRGAGDTKWSFYISIIGMWGVRLIIAYVLINVFALGLVGAWIAMFSDLTIRGILCLVRYFRYGWLKPYTDAEKLSASA